MSKQSKFTVAVLGAGNMGTALAQVMASNGQQVRLWNYVGDPEPLRQIREARENKKYLAGIKLSDNIIPETDLAAAIAGASVVFFVVPSNCVAELIKQAAAILPCGVVCVDASKGIDELSLGLIPDVIERVLPRCLRQTVCSISGPAIAMDMVKGGFTAMAIASKSSAAIKRVKQALENDTLKLVATTDMVGVEVAGSFKNVYAMAMGICDGLRFPMNTKAALLVTALQEIAALIRKMGGREQTVYGLAGLGDLVGTGLCATSRNRRFGELLATGLDKDQACTQVAQVVEGVTACRILLRLGKKYQVKLPFAEMVYDVVWKKSDPARSLNKYLSHFN